VKRTSVAVAGIALLLGSAPNSLMYRAIPAVLVGTGLRPEKLFGLDRGDVDRKNGVLRLERVYSQGRLKP
jgi:integrase